MESLGPAEIEAQVEQARLDMEEEEEEEEGAGDEYRLGDWCRARWSEDQLVYEATVKSVDRKKGTAKVEFVGFGNIEVKQLEDLYMSKGEERRLEQQEFSQDVDIKGGIKDEDLQNLLIKNCPDLLANFGGATAAELSLENLVIDEESKEKKKEKKDKKKGKEKKEKVKEASGVKSEPESAPRSAPFLPPNPNPLSNMFPPQFPPYPTPPQFPGMASPFLPSGPQLQSPFQPQFQPPSLPYGDGVPPLTAASPRPASPAGELCGARAALSAAVLVPGRIPHRPLPGSRSGQGQETE